MDRPDGLRWIAWALVLAWIIGMVRETEAADLYKCKTGDAIAYQDSPCKGGEQTIIEYVPLETDWASVYRDQAYREQLNQLRNWRYFNGPPVVYFPYPTPTYQYDQHRRHDRFDRYDRHDRFDRDFDRRDFRRGRRDHR